MILPAAIVIALITAAVRGGSLRHLADLRLRFGWMFLLAFFLQAYVVYFPAGKDTAAFDIGRGLLVSSYLLLLMAVCLNWHLAAMRLLGPGLILNFVAILANGGYMPVAPESLTQSGYQNLVSVLEPGSRVFLTKDVLIPRDEIQLYALGDIFVLPLPKPIASVFSPGDVLIAIGTFLLIQTGLSGQRRRVGYAFH
ncbi:MAG: DUF5317 domain-containing protein [Chloroflexi bacterium]|nr:DUF5317 domain-containing protein [Chloroflexota bacterium]MDA8187260.1 DUF5317 domain-containing protein [Dehalococcoidales bacterium]